MTHIALSIAGSDPSGGAGIQADLKTFAAFDVHGAAALTALTAQNTRGVFGVHGVPPDFIEAQIRAVLGDLAVDAIKIGMLGDVATIETVAKVLADYPEIPIVLDPVMVAAGGDPLLAEDAVSALRERLIPRATIVTPNAHEAALLLGRPKAASADQLREQAQSLVSAGARAVLLKSGRVPFDARIVDVFIGADGHCSMAETPRLRIDSPHGGGCTLSSAIAAGLAGGQPLPLAVAHAQRFVWEALERAQHHKIGGGSTPLVLPPRGGSPSSTGPSQS